MKSVRAFQAAVATRALIFAAVSAALVAALARSMLPGVTLVAGTLVGLAYLFHIAASFNRLTKGGKQYLPLLTVESLVRVLLAGAVPFIIVGRGPALAYFSYLAGFVAPLAVAILVYRKQINVDSVQTDAATQASAKTTA
ncbi:MAG TPA: hypothetical protein VGQ96_03960 [Candidatus Eremiobacteraceae bacterium]|nr:hypothetical protein [Candidatus Eremiobacteraceae bacterium]